MAKNAQISAQLHASHMLEKWCSKFSKPSFSSTWTMKFQMFKLDLENSEDPEIKLPTSVGSSKQQESSRKSHTAVLLTMPAFDCVDHNKLWKVLQEMGIPDHLACLLRNLCAVQEATVRTGHGTTAVAAAAKMLQSCLTLCDLIDKIPTGFSVHRIPQARTLESAANFLLQSMHAC